WIGRDGPARPRAPACDADITVGAAASGHAAIGARLASWDAELPAPGDWTRRAEAVVAGRAADTLAADESGTGDAVRRTVFGAAADDIHRHDAGAAAVRRGARADGHADETRADAHSDAASAGAPDARGPARDHAVAGGRRRRRRGSSGAERRRRRRSHGSVGGCAPRAGDRTHTRDARANTDDPGTGRRGRDRSRGIAREARGG